MRVDPRKPSVAWTARACVLGLLGVVAAGLMWLWDAAPWQLPVSALVLLPVVAMLGGMLDIRVDRKRGIVP